MSSHHQLAGKRFLADLAEALPDAHEQTPSAAPATAASGRPILGGAKVDLPDTAAHSWNVDVPDFVPFVPASNPPVSRQQQQSMMPAAVTNQQAPPPWQQHSGGSSGIGQPSARLSSDPIIQLVNQSLAILAGASGSSGAGDEDRDRIDAELNACLMRLYQLSLTREDLTRLVSATVNMARQNRSLCEPAANLLAFLSVNFVVSQQVCPHLISDRPGSRLAFNPLYEAVLLVCSSENEQIKKGIAAMRAVSAEQANYIMLFSWLYMYLPSLQMPTQRQSAMAQNTVLFLKQLANLPACPLAFRTIHAALTAIGAPLDFDCCDPDVAERTDLFGQLGEFYDQLRTAAASGSIGDPVVSIDIIRLLEFRAAGWMSRSDLANSMATNYPPATGGGFGGQQQPYSSVSGDMQSMSDDMYADYELFLRDSGQL